MTYMIIVKKIALTYTLMPSLRFEGLSGNFWLVSFKISYLCLPLFYGVNVTI